MADLWRTLRVGDRVRIIHMPQEFASDPGTYLLHDETREIYEHLISESAILAVTKVDDLNMPWIEYTWVRDDGTEEFHSLLLNHDGLERVA